MDTRCEWSDLPESMCAHCRGGEVGMAGTGDVAVITRPRVRAVVRSTELTALARRRFAPLPRRRDYPALCVNPGCRPEGKGGPRATGGRGNTCDVCEDRLRENLVAIAAVAPDLERALTVTAPFGRDGAGTPDPGLALNEAAVEARARCAFTVGRVAGLVVEGRALTVGPAALDTATVAAWLARSHVPWLVTYPAADTTADVVVAVRDAARAAHAAAYPSGARRITIPTRCAAQVHDHPACAPTVEEPCRDRAHWRECGGGMSALIRPRADVAPDLECDSGDVGHAVPPSVWCRGRVQAATDIDPVAARRLVTAIANPTRYTTGDTE